MIRKDLPLGEHETKYVLPNRRAKVVSSWLTTRCKPDPKYPIGTISSIYFDTRDWKLLGEKLNSDHLKTKVRLRWYSDYPSGWVQPTTFLEMKSKIGTARKKVRIKTDIDAADILKTSLDSLEMLQIPKSLCSHGIVVTPSLHPVFQLNYMRRRFIDPLTGARLAIDSNIHVSRVNKRMIQKNRSTTLPEAVFELKHVSGALPEWLHQLTAFGCQKSSFSKYSSCYQHLTGILF